jgi:hypothetical protein
MGGQDRQQHQEDVEVVEPGEELAPLMVERSSSSPPQRERHDPPVDWLMTALLFLSPAIGGALFG